MNFKQLTAISLMLCCVAAVTAQQITPVPQNEMFPPSSKADVEFSPAEFPDGRPADNNDFGRFPEDLYRPNPRQQNPPEPLPAAVFYSQAAPGTDEAKGLEFSCIEYRGQPLNVHLTGDEWSLPQVVSMKGERVQPVDPSSVSQQWLSGIDRLDVVIARYSDGSAPSAAPEFPGNSLLLICEDGYKITTAKTLLQSGTSTELNRFRSIKGTVTFTGAANLHGVEIGAPQAGLVMGETNFFLVAQWESIPFHLELVGQPASMLQHGPGLFRVFVTARLDIDQMTASFETKVPAGRVQFSIMQGDPTDTMDWEPTGISWWETVNPADDRDILQQLTPPTVELSVVKGQIKQTNKLLEALTTIEQVDGRAEIGRSKLSVFFESGDNPGSDIEVRPIAELLRDAAIWGRPGGEREKSDYQSAMGRVAEDGSFSCVIPTSLATDSVVGILKDRSHFARDVPVTRTPVMGVETLSGQPTIDLGIIDPEQYIESGAQPREWQVRTFEGPSDIENGYVKQFEPAPTWGEVPPIRPLRAAPADWGQSEPRGTSPVKVAAEPATSPIDRTIADLVAQLLSSGDRRTRQTMKEPLKKLLEQRFDAEQKAREQLLNELRTRFDQANQQVTERATRRDVIINEQLQRMLSLPEDDFEVLPDADSGSRGDIFGDSSDGDDRFRRSSNDEAPPWSDDPTPDLNFGELRVMPAMLDLNGQPIVDQRDQTPFVWAYEGLPVLIYSHSDSWNANDPNRVVLQKIWDKYWKYGFEVLEVAGENTPSDVEVESDWPVLVFPTKEHIPPVLQTKSAFSLLDAKGKVRYEFESTNFKSMGVAVEELLREMAYERRRSQQTPIETSGDRNEIRQ